MKKKREEDFGALKKKEDKLAELYLPLFLFVVCVFGIFLFFKLIMPSKEVGNPPVVTDEAPLSDAEKRLFNWVDAPLTPKTGAATANVDSAINSKYMLLMDAEGNVIAQKNADTPFSPASLTKIMSLIVFCEQYSEDDLNRRLELTDEIQQYVTTGNNKDTETGLIDGKKNNGDTFLVKDLLYGVGVKSASDCVMMLVCDVCPRDSIAESEEAFAELMNKKALEMGLTGTHFDNPIGYDSIGNTASAKDLAVITEYALRCSMIADILSCESYDFQGYDPDGFVSKADGQTHYEYTMHFYNTFFNEGRQGSRMNTYKTIEGKSFSLDGGWQISAVKTGSFGTKSFISVELAKNQKKCYLILGEAEASAYASILTLKDIQKLVTDYLK